MYKVHNMHWYKDKPPPPGSWYVGRPKVGQDWPILANMFIPIGQRTRFDIISPTDRLYNRRYDHAPTPNNQIVFTSLDPIADYRRWLWRQLNTNLSVVYMLIEDMARMGEGVLLCWCAPNPCHADVIARAIDWRRDQIIESIF